MKNLFVVVLGVSLSLLCMQSVNALPSLEQVQVVDPAFDFVGTLGETGVESQGMPVLDQQEIPQISPRITCDLMSGWVWGERLCAAGCIAKGYRGGWCDSHKVCNCRK